MPMLEAEANLSRPKPRPRTKFLPRCRSVWLKWLSLFDRCSLVRFRQRQMRRSSAAVLLF